MDGLNKNCEGNSYASIGENIRFFQLALEEEEGVPGKNSCNPYPPQGHGSAHAPAVSCSQQEQLALEPALPKLSPSLTQVPEQQFPKCDLYLQLPRRSHPLTA